MNTEFLLLIPGVLYGVGLVDLVKLSFRRHYYEIYMWAFVLLVTIVLQWYSLYNNIGMAEDNPAIFLLMLIVPLIYTQSCYILTPDKGDDTKEYFLNNRKSLFLSLTALAVTNSILQAAYAAPDERTIARLILVPLLIIAIFWDKRWYRISLFVFFVVLYSQFFIR